ncbi:hypothetical protein OGR47_02570 [Methylocystis sp. MJC1]|uniref:hypothetical protein n=1 Tax=Methylocystis sp. MJC1 TaxID=2654282 RepID=UPI0013EDDA07|nr:hypothetical protein [Methylocystis sp. MJC1]KAF2989149.1 hypothetical protein MJC1_03731 [Methylocystis sp. MJC1]MBU6525896.1 hypothetical protein [Methylocystis sp. MJC1]UZX12363.1 hypothetical protein OGR47_02570 [Methylocystis sp. MJC1]
MSGANFLSGIYSEGDNGVIVWQGFDFDGGVVLFGSDPPDGNTVPPDADLWFSGDCGFVPVNGALLAVLGKPDFDSVSLDTLKAQQYSNTPWPDFGFNGIPEGVVLAVKTNQGRYAKIRTGAMQLTPWGYCIKFHWVTFSNLGWPLRPSLAGVAVLTGLMLMFAWSIRCVLWGGCP